MISVDDEVLGICEVGDRGVSSGGSDDKINSGTLLKSHYNFDIRDTSDT
jgi:hypothetical protein